MNARIKERKNERVPRDVAEKFSGVKERATAAFLSHPVCAWITFLCARRLYHQNDSKSIPRPRGGSRLISSGRVLYPYNVTIETHT